jgi:glycosyltransferase involved in cell wall biosynthesis
MEASSPRVLVFSSLFPSPADPNAGVFIRERMFRVAKRLPIVVVSPKPWSPFDWLVRLFRPRFRPSAPVVETQQGIRVYYPRFFSIPGVLKHWDSTFMALGSYLAVKKLKKEFGFNLIDAHFGYPDGHAASLLARRFNVPLTITLRGSERTYVEMPQFRRRIVAGLNVADKVIGVSGSLTKLAVELGVPEDKTISIGNAVDCQRFEPVDRAEARRRYELNETDPVIISVGWLIERKGFHRVIEVMPELIRRHPGLCYLIVGGPAGADSMESRLRQQVATLGLQDHVKFLGPMKPDDLKWPLSAADLFVLATSREGWANVFLEAMACGLPVITTDVDGNAEVVCRAELGQVVPFGNPDVLASAVDHGLTRTWDRKAIRAYAEANSWDNRVDTLCLVIERSVYEKQGWRNKITS